MTLAFETIQPLVISHALRLGVFEFVNEHEPKSAPQSGIGAAVWVDDIGPAPGASGLDSTTGRLAFKIRIYTSFLAEPEDMIDPRVMEATYLLLAAYSGDFTLGDQVRQVDLLGAYGVALSAKAGYLNQDGKIYRIMDIVLPLIINDVWAQVP